MASTINKQLDVTRRPFQPFKIISMLLLLAVVTVAGFLAYSHHEQYTHNPGAGNLSSYNNNSSQSGHTTGAVTPNSDSSGSVNSMPPSDTNPSNQ